MSDLNPKDCNKDGNELELSHGNTKLRARGTDVMLLMGIVCLVLTTYILYEHKIESKETTQAFIKALNNLQVAQEKTTNSVINSNRYVACILSISQDTREKQFDNPASYCNRQFGQ